VLDQVPAEFEEFLTEPAFSMAETTFCIWRRNGDPSWQTGQIEYPDEGFEQKVTQPAKQA
jgi:hypothetical protein